MIPINSSMNQCIDWIN